MSEFCVWKCFELFSDSVNLRQGKGAKQRIKTQHLRGIKENLPLSKV